jgi:hypothetical protein
MADLTKIFLFRMTHIDNIPHIVQYGITHGSSPNRNEHFRAIGDNSLINARSQFRLANGRTLGEYTPFYFGPRMPMLYVIQKGFNNVPSTPPEDIVYYVCSVQKILDTGLDFVFTNGHAIDGLSSIYEKGAIERLEELLDFEAIQAKFWKNESDLDIKRRKEAEFLVDGDLPLSVIVGYAVYAESSKTKLENWGIPPKMIAVRPNFYF